MKERIREHKINVLLSKYLFWQILYMNNSLATKDSMSLNCFFVRFLLLLLTNKVFRDKMI